MKNVGIHDGDHVGTVIVGGGQAGLSVSHELLAAGEEHVILEKDTVVHQWHDARWDNFTLVTPNWHCRLPGYTYDGPLPDGFMRRDEVYDWVRGYADSFDAPVAEGVTVTLVERVGQAGFRITTDHGTVTADRVVSATGGYHLPSLPDWAGDLPSEITQIHSHDYRNAGQLPDGGVLVVGTGQSGTQIAEDLFIAGRPVHLALGHAPRVARFYRGMDCMTWLARMGVYDVPAETRGLAKRESTNHYVTGRDGGRDIDLRAFALRGMGLHGRALGVTDGAVVFDDTVTEKLDHADSVAESIKDDIDAYIAREGINAPVERRYEPVWTPDGDSGPLPLDRISSVVWCNGFRSDWSWLGDLPVLDAGGHPAHRRGVTDVPGFYFIGLPWMHTWGSGRFLGVAEDARHLVSDMVGASCDSPTPAWS
jgi:putative flavoprotein involved in K+ transport